MLNLSVAVAVPVRVGVKKANLKGQPESIISNHQHAIKDLESSRAQEVESRTRAAKDHLLVIVVHG